VIPARGSIDCELLSTGGYVQSNLGGRRRGDERRAADNKVDLSAPGPNTSRTAIRTACPMSSR